MTAPEPPERPDRSPVVVVCATVIALALIAVWVWQQATGRDSGTTIVVLVAILGASVPGFAAHTRAGQLQRDVTAVRTQTNGNTTALLELLGRTLDQLALAQPPAPASTPPAEPVWPAADGDPPTSP